MALNYPRKHGAASCVRVRDSRESASIDILLRIKVAHGKDFFFRSQQVSRGEVLSSEEISVVDSVNCWLMYGSS